MTLKNTESPSGISGVKLGSSSSKKKQAHPFQPDRDHSRQGKYTFNDLGHVQVRIFQR